MSEKTAGERLRDLLAANNKNGYERIGDEKIAASYAFSEGYRSFLDQGKTERRAAAFFTEKAKECGYREFECGKHYAPGSRLYLLNRGKSLILARIGSRPLEEGINIAAAHIDCPRIDLKPTPLYEDGGMAFFKTHYYGGIKKYHWVTIPLALYGTVIRADGTAVEISVGDKDGDPVFHITDLLPHLGKDQMEKTLASAFTGENLNVLAGSRPYPDEKVTDRIKLNLLKHLYDAYGIVEDDFRSAELSLVPACRARDIGFDRSMLGSYGHDDRVCAYTSALALLDAQEPEKTAVVILTDKEEIGSEGNTGLKSNYFYDFVTELALSAGQNPRRVFAASKCLSADVSAAYDPNFAEAYDKRNSAMLNGGVTVIKYTGSRGKSGTSDASAEFMGTVRRALDQNGVLWQTGELGKVDQGGGGTVAMYLANLNIDVVDFGVPVLSMHSPFEVVSKLDVYSTYEGVKSFFENVKE